MFHGIAIPWSHIHCRRVGGTIKYGRVQNLNPIMSVDNKVEDPRCTLRRKCAECVKGPNLIRTLIVAGCVVVVVQQITVCIWKLIEKPITTYTHFDFNKTVVYPSITFCREPPYKFDKMLDYGLFSHPRFTSVWVNFNFSHTSLDELWGDITYDDKEMFVQYGLNGLMENVELTPILGFALGRCFTMSPKVLGSQPGKKNGYSITLQHSANDIASTTSLIPPGYHVFVHYTKEPFTEVMVYNGGLVDTMYVNVGETLEAKLKVDEYVMISREDDPCTDETNYSTNACTSQHVWDQVGHVAGCSGPWMTSNLPRCDNYNNMRSLIIAYMNTYENHDSTACPRICRSYLYNGVVTDRQRFYIWDTDTGGWSKSSGDALLETHLYIYFNSMMVSVYEERYNYDWNLFISDLGGSIGFLLGLSVIGLLKMFGNTWSEFVEPFIKEKQVKRAASITSSTTANVNTISKKHELDGDWHMRN